jgi:hypothetical protein
VDAERREIETEEHLKLMADKETVSITESLTGWLPNKAGQAVVSVHAC